MNVLHTVHFPPPIDGLLRSLGEVEFIAQRPGGREIGTLAVREWNIIALPLPFISILINFSEATVFDGVVIRFPIPEAFFIHKLIVVPRRLSVEKREKDLEQCTALVPVLKRTAAAGDAIAALRQGDPTTHSAILRGHRFSTTKAWILKHVAETAKLLRNHEGEAVQPVPVWHGRFGLVVSQILQRAVAGDAGTGSADGTAQHLVK